MEEYNKQGEEYAKNITSIPRYQALEDYVPNYLKDPMGVGLFMGLVDEGYFAPEDLIYEGPREDKASEIDPEYKSLSNDIRIMASESEKRSTMETVLVVFIIIIFVLLVIFFIFYLARTGNLSKLAKAGVENMNSDAQYDQNSEYSE